MDPSIEVIKLPEVSPAGTMVGFDINKLFQDNFDKWATYLKVGIAAGIVFGLNHYNITPNNVLIDAVSLVVAKVILDIIHFCIKDVKLR